MNHHQTTVIIIGTIHLEPKEYPAYARKLGEIIEEIHPDLICSELSPEQLAKTQPCNSKPEQRDIIMPTAERLGIPIVPIQPPTEYGTKWEKRFKAADQKCRAKEPDRRYIEYAEHLAQQEALLWGEAMKAQDSLEDMQLPVYHVFPQARDEVDRKLTPERQAILDEWNEFFLKRIEEAIENNPGRTILVMAGLWHKYWLWNRLENRPNITLHNLQSFRQTLKSQ